jgi:hypothetical protein
LLGEVVHWVASTGGLVGNAITALPQHDSWVADLRLALPQVQRPAGRVVGLVDV